MAGKLLSLTASPAATERRLGRPGQVCLGLHPDRSNVSLGLGDEPSPIAGYDWN